MKRVDVPAIEMLHITKRFPGVIANDQVDFSAQWGEVHALIGENGAGKTTLMNILYGLLPADSGEIKIFGRTANITSAGEAIGLGIGMVHQHFMLVPAFTALENIILGAEPVRFGRTDYREAGTRIRGLCARFQLEVDLNARVADLSVSSQQKVEILKALYRDARILILDEPASVLAPQEAENLFSMLRRMAGEGMCIILISHKLNEVMTYSGRVTVLRQGKTIECVKTASTSPEELTRLMVGSDVIESSPKAQAATTLSPSVLTVDDLTVIGESGLPAVDLVSFEVGQGKILGIAGVDGNGQRELAEALIGLREATGSARMGRLQLLGLSTRERLDAGIAYIPEDRRFAVIPDAYIEDNAILGRHWGKGFARLGVLNPAAVRSHANALIEEFDVRGGSPDLPVRFLSGGNQQKLVLGRALSHEPELIIACQPTRGLDVNAAAEIHNHLRAGCARGAGVLLISYDLDEILALSDRIMVMFQGCIAGILRKSEADRESIGALMVGAA
jgi:ABC-type uncharacterized transport system ATPase subunit